MQTVYRRIRPYKVTEEIVAQVKSLIKDGTLQPGEKLPSERILCGLLGVGRSSIREAVNVLEALGFLEIKNRKGVFVRSVSSPLVFDPLVQILQEDKGKLGDLYGIRKDIELASAYLAAKLRTKKDLTRMKEFLRRLEREALEYSRLSVRDDVGLHLAVAQASGNFLRVHILRNIFDLAGDFYRVSGERITRGGEVITVYEQHLRLFQAIEKMDPEGARTRMEEHLTWGEVKWKEWVMEIQAQE
jgi:GntR family transcriptional regulator, transcriptional repressor for pyruvate dehydrogenase complex